MQNVVYRAIVVWFVLLVIAVLNGTFRVAVLIPRMGDAAAHVVSTILLCAEMLVLAWFTVPWIAIPNGARAVAIGLLWVALTLVFEFGFGHYVSHKPWSELLADYDILRGRIWPLVLVTTAVAPWLVSRLRVWR